MNLKEKLKAASDKRRLKRIERQKIENQRELIEYNKRQERYNDMLRDEAQKQKFLNNLNKIRINTFTKKMVTTIIAVCLMDIQITYILALMDRQQIAESLSTQICITIISVAFVYMVRAYFDSKAEHKNLDNKIKAELEEGLASKLQDVLSAAGINIDVSNIFNKDEDDCEDDNSPIKPPKFTYGSMEEDPSALDPGLHVNKKPKPNPTVPDEDGTVG